MAAPKNITVELVWDTIVSLGKDWTVSGVARALQVTRPTVQKFIKQGDLKQKWQDLQNLGEDVSPATQETIERVARRIKLEDLNSSTAALETFNQAIVKAAEHLIEKIPNLDISKPSEFVAVMNAISVAIPAQTAGRKELAEIVSLMGMGGGEKPDEETQERPDAGNVFDLRSRVQQGAGK